MIWESPHEMRWETGYAHARKYWEKQGHLLVPYAFETEGFPLRAWIAQMRYQRMAPNRHRLTEEQVQKLDAIGMVWNKVDIAFEQGYEAARRFFEENGHLDVPAAYVSENGYKLGAWLGKLRERRDHLPSDQMDRMEKLGNWLNAQKRRYYAGKLEEDRMKCLLQIGADWIDLQTIIPAPDARMHPLPRKNQAERKNKAV